MLVTLPGFVCRYDDFDKCYIGMADETSKLWPVRIRLKDGQDFAVHSFLNVQSCWLYIDKIAVIESYPHENQFGEMVRKEEHINNMDALVP